MRVLVTGAAGFIGANLVRRLLRDGHEVHAVINYASDNWRLADILSDVSLHKAMLEDDDIFTIMDEVQPETVYHLAANGVYSNQKSVSDMLMYNNLATLNVYMACLQTRVKILIHAGSSLEYGYKDHPASENEPLAPTTPYGMTKALATSYLQQMSQYGGIRVQNIITLRLYSVYGPYEAPIRLIPALIEHGLRGKLPPMANPDNARDFVYVEDVCDAFIKAANAPYGSQIYNVGTGKQTTLREVVDVSRQYFSIQAEAHWNTSENRAWDTSCWIADNRKIKEQLGWQPRYTFEEGFRQTVEWTKEQEFAKSRI